MRARGGGAPLLDDAGVRESAAALAAWLAQHRLVAVIAEAIDALSAVRQSVATHEAMAA